VSVGTKEGQPLQIKVGSSESSSRERRAHTSKEINTDGISRSPKITLLIFEIHKLAERYFDRLLAEGEIYTAHNTVSIRAGHEMGSVSQIRNVGEASK
jgi:hypothetical protein